MKKERKRVSLRTECRGAKRSDDWWSDEEEVTKGEATKGEVTIGGVAERPTEVRSETTRSGATIGGATDGTEDRNIEERSDDWRSDSSLLVSLSSLATILDACSSPQYSFRSAPPLITRRFALQLIPRSASVRSPPYRPYSLSWTS